MEVLKASSFRSFRRQPNEPIPIRNPSNLFKIPCTFPRFTKINPPTQKLDLKTFAATSPVAPWADQASPPPEQEAASEKKEEKFDWYENWYPVAAVCDLDKRRPHGKKVIGIDLVVWWDRNENAWKVFDDSCPHRLAPLSEGRIDQSGRLQCVYHGWCFGGAGDCKFIPQAPRDGPPVHSWKKACVQGVYPSCVQNEMVWFWPNSDPQYKDIYLNKKPPYIPELGDPSFTNSMMSREIPYGYEVLTENFMDPAHVPYAHYGVLEIEKVAERCTAKSDREGGREIEFSVGKVDVNGFSANQLTHANYYFIPPCLYYGRIAPHTTTTTTTTKDATIPLVPLEKTIVLIFYCIPVSPGCSRVIFASPRNFAVQIDRILPRWISHIKENLILDSDLFLLHLEERKLKDLDWHKSCYTPTRSDAQILAFRRWLNKYGGSQVDWRNKFPATLPPTPPREQLMDRYWSHTVSCSSCSLAYKLFNALEIGLQVISIASIAVAAAGAISIGARYSLASMAVLCFVASKWLSRFIYKTFRYHGYDHAFK